MGTRFYIDIEQAKARISEIGLTNAARELNIRPGTLANRVSNKTKNPEKLDMEICQPPHSCFERPYSGCIRSGASRALPTKEELKFMNTGKARPYSRSAPKKPPKPKKNPCFIDAGELTEKQRERLTARIMKEISRPGKEK